MAELEQVLGSIRLVIGDNPPIVAFWPGKDGGINRVQDGFEPNSKKAFVVVYMFRDSDGVKGSIFWDGLPKEAIIKTLRSAAKTLEADQSSDRGITDFEWVKSPEP